MSRNDPIRVYEGSDPMIQYELSAEAGGPFDLSDFTSISWFVRESTIGPLPEEPNRSTEPVPGGIELTDAPGGKCSVQVRATDLGEPGNKWCYLIGISAEGLVTPLSFRPMKVLGT